MGKKIKIKYWMLFAVLLLLVLYGLGTYLIYRLSPSVTKRTVSQQVSDNEETVNESGEYYTKEEVASYIEKFDKLPGNFITTEEAKEKGWRNGFLDPYAPGKCIGGDVFKDERQRLPVKNGRIYYECDINTLYARSRGKKRLVYSNDGLILYTEDNFRTYQLMYGDLSEQEMGEYISK